MGQTFSQTMSQRSYRSDQGTEASEIGHSVLNAVKRTTQYVKTVRKGGELAVSICMRFS